MANYELGDLYEAFCWLKKSSFVDGRKIGIIGGSRGAELALLYASHVANDPQMIQPDAVVANCPSDVTYGAWNLDWEDPVCWLKWDRSERDKGRIPGSDAIWNPQCGEDPRTRVRGTMSAWQWQGAAILADQVIEIERYAGPLMLSHGTADTIWDAGKTKRLESRLIQAGRKPEVHYFGGEGHWFSPSARDLLNKGIIDFLDRSLFRAP